MPQTLKEDHRSTRPCCPAKSRDLICHPGRRSQVRLERPTTGARLKKRIVRTVIREVVADIDAEAAEIILVIHWMGGIHTELRLPRRRRGQRNSTAPDIIAAVRHLVLIANDDLIAGILIEMALSLAMVTAGPAGG